MFFIIYLTFEPLLTFLRIIILQRLESNKFVFSNNLNVLLMDLYAQHERLDDALAILNAIYASTPDFNLTASKLFRLATSLLKGDRTEDMFKILERLNIASDEKQENVRYDIFSSRLLDVAVTKGDVELTSKLFEIFEKSGLKITGLVASSLVKVHVVRYGTSVVLLVNYSSLFHDSLFFFLLGKTSKLL